MDFDKLLNILIKKNEYASMSIKISMRHPLTPIPNGKENIELKCLEVYMVLDNETQYNNILEEHINFENSNFSNNECIDKINNSINTISTNPIVYLDTEEFISYCKTIL